MATTYSFAVFPFQPRKILRGFRCSCTGCFEYCDRGEGTRFSRWRLMSKHNVKQSLSMSELPDTF